MKPKRARTSWRARLGIRGVLEKLIKEAEISNVGELSAFLEDIPRNTEVVNTFLDRGRVKLIKDGRTARVELS